MPPGVVDSLEEQLAAQKRPMQRHPPIHPVFRILSRLVANGCGWESHPSHRCRSARKHPLDGRA
jgi:hypothetical protein